MWDRESESDSPIAVMFSGSSVTQVSIPLGLVILSWTVIEFRRASNPCDNSAPLLSWLDSMSFMVLVRHIEFL
jgi:hypothetical protein